MGTAGNRKGYKIFSFDTSVRNPERNPSFLAILKKYDNTVLDKKRTDEFLIDIVKSGTYRFSIESEIVRRKLENDEELTSEEVKQLIEDNPQATGKKGRVFTQLRSLKNQGFVMFKNSRDTIKITKLGEELLSGNVDPSLIYTKIMVGLHANGPSRTAMLNKSRPFMNTIFAINHLKQVMTNRGEESKGILMHEFGVFILSMKDCDYKRAVNDILEYRSLHGFTINEEYLTRYLEKKKILKINFKTATRDYPDEVARKFIITGLLRRRGKMSYRYLDFSQYNIEKIQSIIKKFDNYKFKKFDNSKKYIDYLANIKLPWEDDELLKRRIIEGKSKRTGIKIDEKLLLSEQEDILDRIFYKKGLEKVVNKVELSLLIKELLILTGKSSEQTSYDGISEPLRLEYILALMMAKRFGTDGLISNIVYNEDGYPQNHAGANKADIIFHSKEGSYILEPTLTTNRTQQLNHETTNIIRHVDSEMKKYDAEYRVMMIAPRIHIDVATFFKYVANQKGMKIIPITITKLAHLFNKSETIEEFNVSFDTLVNEFKEMEVEEYLSKVNNYTVEL